MKARENSGLRVGATEDSDGPSREWGWSVAVCVFLALPVTMWLGMFGFGHVNVGSDCLHHLAESERRVSECTAAVNTANTWMPWTVCVTWLCVPLGYLLPRTAAVAALACAVAAAVLGMLVSNAAP